MPHLPSFIFMLGDKIVTVNGKSLSGLTYRESTDFIRQCPGPNVKMGIIKHALHKKEGIMIFSQEQMSLNITYYSLCIAQLDQYSTRS